MMAENNMASNEGSRNEALADRDPPTLLSRAFSSSIYLVVAVVTAGFLLISYGFGFGSGGRRGGGNGRADTSEGDASAEYAKRRQKYLERAEMDVRLATARARTRERERKKEREAKELEKREAFRRSVGEGGRGGHTLSPKEYERQLWRSERHQQDSEFERALEEDQLREALAASANAVGGGEGGGGGGEGDDDELQKAIAESLTSSRKEARKRLEAGAPDSVAAALDGTTTLRLRFRGPGRGASVEHSFSASSATLRDALAVAACLPGAGRSFEVAQAFPRRVLCSWSFKKGFFAGRKGSRGDTLLGEGGEGVATGTTLMVRNVEDE